MPFFFHILHFMLVYFFTQNFSQMPLVWKQPYNSFKHILRLFSQLQALF